MGPVKCRCAGGEACRKQPPCSEAAPCNKGLNYKWGQANGTALRRDQWRCPECLAVLRCRSCCNCVEDSHWGGSRRQHQYPGAKSIPKAPPLTAPVAATARSRSPRHRVGPAAPVAAPPPPPPPQVPFLTQALRGTDYTDAEIKSRKARVYELETFSKEPGDWPLPGHSTNELDLQRKRDTVPYRGVAGGRWKDALWLDYVRDVLNSEQWTTHHQTWSLREEMFITWAHENRLKLVSAGQAPASACLSREEQREQSERRRQANFIGNIISRSLYS